MKLKIGFICLVVIFICHCTGEKEEFSIEVQLNNELVNALKNNDSKAYEEALMKGAKPISALIYVSCEGNIEIIQRFLNKGVDINERENGYGGKLPFLGAVGNGHIEAVKYMLDKGADINKKDGHGSTALIVAIANEELDMVKLLTEKGANINEVASETKNSPLSIAAEKGYIDVVRLLIEKGADINNQGGTSPLNEAVVSKKIEIIKLLLGHGADVNAKDGWPLMNAASNGQTEIVKLLLEKGADPKLKSKRGRTALDYATEKGHQEIIKILSEWQQKKQ